ncbi:MAG: sulfatase [Planctomycetes bacterium]|nr:sulfatase [Planctomycetota bacterium]
MHKSLLLIISLFLTSSLFAGKRPNILFIAVDDLRPELGCYGSKIIKSPNIDRLTNKGMRFDRAYCQQAICGPSRASLMTGCRPETINVIENKAYFRELNPDIVTIPQHFIKNGYEAFYSGKIYHGGHTDPKHSWSRKPAFQRMKVANPGWKNGGYALPKNQAIYHKNKKAMLAKYGKEGSSGLIHGPAYECADVPDHAYRDGYSTLLAIETLKDHLQKSPEKPLFIGLGFAKPHLHFIAPKKYWDLYNPEDIQLATQKTGPQGGAAIGLHASFELSVRHGIPKTGPIPEKLSRTLLHAYYACVSYIDAQVGLMMKALEETGQLENTIVVLWGDHGWHLGEMGVWGKATNYEIGTRVPLIISAPGMKARGKSTESIVELLDLYPTLCDLAGISVPTQCEGQSIKPLLNNPLATGKNRALSQFPAPALREWAANPLSFGMRQTFFGPLITEVEGRIIDQHKKIWDRELFENHIMGYSLRTDKHRFVSWRDRRNPEANPVYIELYNHINDPNETKNVASKHPQLVSQLNKVLRNTLNKK